MCGIIGIIGRHEVSGRLVDGLRRLEYRGYDSAGVCTIVNGAFERRRAEGKLDNLVRVLDGQPLSGTIGIAHTRWATHGAPTVGNADPHIVDGVALVHNGIIENFKPLRDEMRKLGRHFESETDSEVVAHLIAAELEKGRDPQAAVAAVLPRLEGAFAITILFRDHPDLLIGARMGAPLTIGYGEGETFLGSDALALAPLTQRISYLDEGDWAVITRDGATVYNRANAQLNEHTLADLCERCPNLVGFKDGVGDVELMTRLFSQMGDRLTYVGGLPTAETFALPYLEMGVTTYSSAIFNFLPEWALNFYAAVRRRDREAVYAELRAFVLPYIAIRNRRRSYAVSIVKAGMTAVGRPAGPVRSPLTDLDAAELQELTALIGDRR